MTEEVKHTPFVFEPHNGYGAKDPDGEPWPFGYISEGYGRPLFELSPVVVHPYEKLHDAALKMTAAPELYEALKGAWPDNLLKVPTHLSDDYVFPVDLTAGELRRMYAALAKAQGREVEG